MKSKLLTGTGIVGVSLLLAASPALAEDATDPSVYLQAVMDNLWVFIAGILVFFMQAGFALVEALALFALIIALLLLFVF